MINIGNTIIIFFTVIISSFSLQLDSILTKLIDFFAVSIFSKIRTINDTTQGFTIKGTEKRGSVGNYNSVSRK